MVRKTVVVVKKNETLDVSKKNDDAENQNQKETSKDETLNQDSNKIQSGIQFEKELKNDEIKRVKKGRPVKEPKVVVRNDKGEKLTKKGTVDKRSEQGLKNLQNSKVYQRILENKKLKAENKDKVAVFSPIVDDDTSDDDVEFVIEEDPDIKEERSQTKLYLEKQEQIREQELKEQLKKFEEENKALKEKFQYNTHLNRISHMASSVKLKF